MRVFKIFILSVMLLLGGFTLAQDEGPVALLELNQQFFYENDPFPIRVSLILPEGTGTMDNPVAESLVASFRVTDLAGKVLARADKVVIEEPSRPKKLVSGSFYGLVLDLAEVFPDIKKTGKYNILWKSGSIQSETLTVHVLPKFDPSRQYLATIKTPGGDIVIRLLGNEAPIAVKAFVDMAHADFYDGLLIHEVRSERFITIGDAATGEGSRVPFLYPAERTAIPLAAGAVVMKPSRPSPPANSSEFMVLLKSEPSWEGQVTVFGQVIQGMDLVRTYSVVATSGRNSRPFFRPLEEIRLEGIEISQPESDEESAGGE